jgi:hypothetical protein
LPPPTLLFVSGVATSNFRFFRCSVEDPAAVVVGVGESEDEEEEMVEEDEVEEAAFDLKWAQIAFINILPREGRDKKYIQRGSFFPSLPFTATF